METRETKKYSGTRFEECLDIGVETQPCLGGQGRQMITNIANEADRENKLMLTKGERQGRDGLGVWDEQIQLYIN